MLSLHNGIVFAFGTTVDVWLYDGETETILK